MTAIKNGSEPGDQCSSGSSLPVPVKINYMILVDGIGFKGG